jgi:hypothetical protein
VGEEAALEVWKANVARGHEALGVEERQRLRGCARPAKTEEEGPSRFWLVRSPSAVAKGGTSIQGPLRTRGAAWLGPRQSTAPCHRSRRPDMTVPTAALFWRRS